MSKSKKIIIGIIAAVLIIGAGFLMLQKPQRAEAFSNADAYENHSLLERVVRTTLGGGRLGDGGGG